jgi:hypothetical protein
LNHRLEYQLQGHLSDARRTGAGNHAEAGADHSRPRATQIGMVEQVEEFFAELQPDLLTDREVLK